MTDFVIICIYDKSNPSLKAFDVCSKSNQRNYQHQFKKTISGERGSRNPLVDMFKKVAVDNIGYETISQLDCSKAEAIKKLDAFAKTHNAITSRTHKLNITSEVKEFLESNSENGSVISDEVEEEVEEVKPPPPTKKVVKQKVVKPTEPSPRDLLVKSLEEATKALELFDVEQAKQTKEKMTKLTQPKASHIPLDLSKLAVDNDALNKKVKQDKVNEKKAKKAEPLIKVEEVNDVLDVVEIDVDEDEAEIKALKAKLDTLKAKKAKKH
jgi:hypothetical protein